MPRRPRHDLTLMVEIAQAQAGVITSQQLRQCGLPQSTVSYRSRPGAMWSRLLPGVHLLARSPASALQRDVAGLLFAGDGALLTGLSALRRGQLVESDGDDGHGDYVHILIPHTRHRGSSAFVRVERTRRLPEPVWSGSAPSLPLAPPARALADAVRRMRDRAEVQALVIHTVRRGAVDIGDLVDELRLGQSRGSAHLRQVIGALTAGVWSTAEADLRPLIAAAGLPEPLWNHRLLASNGAVIAIPDAWVDQIGLAVEVDSRRYHDSGAAWERTMRRNAAYARAGIICLPVTPGQITSDPDGVVRMLREAAQAAALRGRPNVRAVPYHAEDRAPETSVRWAG